MILIPQVQRILLESRLRCYLRRLRDDATDPNMSAKEGLALVRDPAVRVREIRRELEAAKWEPEGIGLACIRGRTCSSGLLRDVATLVTLLL